VQTSEGSGGLQVEEGQETVTIEIRTPSPNAEEQEQSAEENGGLQPKKLQVKKEKPRIRSFTNPAMLRRESTDMEMETYDFRRHKITKQAFRFGQYAVSLCSVGYFKLRGCNY
jgi:hypothetical protein